MLNEKPPDVNPPSKLANVRKRQPHVNGRCRVKAGALVFDCLIVESVIDGQLCAALPQHVAAHFTSVLEQAISNAALAGWRNGGAL